MQAMMSLINKYVHVLLVLISIVPWIQFNCVAYLAL